jgi:hypothetical protein
MFWIYDIPNGLFFIICICFFILFAICMLKLTQKIIVPILKIEEKSNDLLSYFLSAMGVFYGITIGLIAVGAWERFNTVDELATNEASVIAALYRDVSFYPQPTQQALKANIKEYTRYVIEDAWPLQQKGVVPVDGSQRINNIHSTLYSFEPATNSQQAMHAEAMARFNELVVVRRSRLANVVKGLPSTLWLIIFAGGFLNILLCCFFIDENNRLHTALIGLLGALIGSSVFLIAAMDYPYRGEFSVKPEPFIQIYKSLMQ